MRKISSSTKHDVAHAQIGYLGTQTHHLRPGTLDAIQSAGMWGVCARFGLQNGATWTAQASTLTTLSP